MASVLPQLAQGRPTTVCSFDYLSDANIYKLEKPYYFSGPLEKDQEQSRSNLEYTTHGNISLRDLRGSEKQLSLDVHGFQLIKHIPRVSLDHPDDEQIQSYLSETADFLKDTLDVEIVITYNYRVNSSIREQRIFH